MEVILESSRTLIDDAVFVGLFENSVVSGRAAYRQALMKNEISFSELIKLARKAEIPYTLFFAPYEMVQAQLRAKTDKLLQGVTKGTFALNSRQTVELRDIELIVKDLLRKQELLKKHDRTIPRNRIVGLLRRPGTSIEEDVRKLLEALGLAPGAFRNAKSKQAALNVLISCLESNQILVAQSVNNFMPQRLQGIHFSGITVKDTKIPYIFLAGGDHGDQQEPTGRQLFTLTLLTVLVARGIFSPVTYDGLSTASQPGREYELVGEILMPQQNMNSAPLRTLDDIKKLADELKVTPSAAAVRAVRLGLISQDQVHEYLEELSIQFSNRPKPQPRTPKPINAVRKYNGREFSVRMLDALDAGKISAGAFCRTVCLNHIKPSEIHAFREALG